MGEDVVQSILQRLTEIEILLEVDVKNLKERVDNDYRTMENKIHSNNKTMENRVVKIENNNNWLWRRIFVAITITF